MNIYNKIKIYVLINKYIYLLNMINIMNKTKNKYYNKENNIDKIIKS